MMSFTSPQQASNSVTGKIRTTRNQAGRLAQARGANRWRKPPCSFGLRLRGDLQVDGLAEALKWIARRHTALRTHFPDPTTVDFGLCVCPDEVGWLLRTADLRGICPSERAQAEADTYLRTQAPFSPSDFPLFRASLMRYEEEWLLIVAIDHIIFDGASIAIFLAELEHIYRHLLAGGKSAELDETKSDFAEFSTYERIWLDSENADTSLTYWKCVWADFGPFPPTKLPARPRSAGAAGGEFWHRTLQMHAVRRTQQFFPNGHISLFTLAAAAALTALRDITGQPESGLLHPSARRFLVGTEHMVGYLNNRVLLRVPTPATASFQEIADASRSAILKSAEHDMMPFDFLLDSLAPHLHGRRPDYPYIYLNVENQPRPPVLPGLEVSLYWPPQASAFQNLSWISIDLEQGANDVEFTAAYCADRFDKGLVDDLMDRMSHYLVGAD